MNEPYYEPVAAPDSCPESMNFVTHDTYPPVKPEIVDTFRIDVPSAELKTSITKRLAAHKTALEKLSSGRIQLIGVRGDSSEIIKSHDEQIRLLSYVVAHIPENVTYRLSLHELDGLFVLSELKDP